VWVSGWVGYVRITADAATVTAIVLIACVTPVSRVQYHVQVGEYNHDLVGRLIAILSTSANISKRVRTPPYQRYDPLP